MPRLFIAIELPAFVRARLALCAEGLESGSNAPFRRIGAEQLHLTVRFLGSCSDAEVALAQSAMASACEGMKGPLIRICGGGCFPERGQPSVVWAGVECSKELTRLEKRLSEHLDAAGFPPEDRAYRPHITVARACRTGRKASAQALRSNVDRLDWPTLELTAHGVTLLESILSSAGPQYRPATVVPFCSN